MEDGKFIVFEGIDGSGKSYHKEQLGSALEADGHSVLITSEPSHGRMGKLLREYLQEDETPPMVDALLFAADRVEHLEKEIKPALAEGKIIISERYNYSSMAYQAAQGLDMLWLTQVNAFVLIPDLVVYIDISPQTAEKRVSSGEKFENGSFLKKVRDNYEQLAWIYNFKRVSGEPSKDEVSKSIRGVVKKYLEL